MKKTALILGIVGGLVAGALGMKWLGDFGELSELQRYAVQAQLAAQGGSLDKMIVASFILIAGFFAGLAGAFLAFKNKYALAGGLMLGAGVLPVLFAPMSLIFTSLLIAAGIVAFLAHSKRRVAQA